MHDFFQSQLGASILTVSLTVIGAILGVCITNSNNKSMAKKKRKQDQIDLLKRNIEELALLCLDRQKKIKTYNDITASAIATLTRDTAVLNDDISYISIKIEVLLDKVKTLILHNPTINKDTNSNELINALERLEKNTRNTKSNNSSLRTEVQNIFTLTEKIVQKYLNK